MTLHPTSDLGLWVAAFLTLCIFSFLYKDNPFYKFAEHLFVGVSAGYYIILNFWTVVVPNLWEPLVRCFVAPQGPFHASSGDFRIWLVIPGVLGVLLFTRLMGRIGWMSRWSLALIIGVFVGLKTTGFAQSDFVSQVQASVQPFWTGNAWSSFNSVLFLIGLVSSLLFFFFSREHKGLLGGVSKVGIYFLMVSFGAGYGYTVMTRLSLLIGRFQFLLEDWLGYR